MIYSFIISVATGLFLLGLTWACLKESLTSGQKALGLTPAFFGIQQLVESGVWAALLLPGRYTNTIIVFLYTFLFFELIIPPLWISFVGAHYERKALRRKFMYCCFIAGILASIFYLWQLATSHLQIQTINHQIHYQLGLTLTEKRFAMFVFGTAVIAPLFISSMPFMWILGGLAVLEYVVDNFIFYPEFFSMWRLFVIVDSIAVWLIIRWQRPYLKKQKASS